MENRQFHYVTMKRRTGFVVPFGKLLSLVECFERMGWAVCLAAHLLISGRFMWPAHSSKDAKSIKVSKAARKGVDHDTAGLPVKDNRL